MIMGVMALALFAYLFPQKQLDKAKDAIRKHDAQEIKKALDLYYNDHNCYPTSVPFGSSWTQGRTIYMKKVPQEDMPEYLLILSELQFHLLYI